MKFELKYVYKAIINIIMFGVQRSMKGSTTVEELVVSKVTQVGCKISLNRKWPSKNINDAIHLRGALIKAFTVELRSSAYLCVHR